MEVWIGSYVGNDMTVALHKLSTHVAAVYDLDQDLLSELISLYRGWFEVAK